MTGQAFREIAMALRLSWHWLGFTKAVKGQIKEEVAEFLEVKDSKMAKLTKLIIDPKNEWIRKLTSLHSEAEKYWKNHTLPYLEAGIRLCTREKWESLKVTMSEYRGRISDAERALEEHRKDVIEEASQMAGGKLFNPSDYPASFIGCFGFEIEPKNVEPPSYLMKLDPQAYREAESLLNRRMERSMELFEEQVMEGLSKCLNHIVDRMRPAEDGTKKRFDPSCMDNLLELIQKYQSLKVRDNLVLDAMVEDTQKKLANFDLAGMKSSEKVRAQVVESFEALAQEAAKRVTKLPGRRVKLRKVGIENDPQPAVDLSPEEVAA